MKENVIRFSDVESCIIELRDQRVLLDRDVAMLYDVIKLRKPNWSKILTGSIL